MTIVNKVGWARFFSTSRVEDVLFLVRGLWSKLFNELSAALHAVHRLRLVRGGGEAARCDLVQRL